MVRAFAIEFAPYGILANAISPGPTAKPPDASEDEWREKFYELWPSRSP